MGLTFATVGSQESLSVIVPRKSDSLTVMVAVLAGHCAAPELGQIVTPVLGYAVITAGVGVGAGVGDAVGVATLPGAAVGCKEPPTGSGSAPTAPDPPPPHPPRTKDAATKNAAVARSIAISPSGKREVGTPT